MTVLKGVFLSSLLIRYWTRCWPTGTSQRSTGFAFDGQYLTEALSTTLRSRLLGDDCIKSQFALPINWDCAHFLNLAVLDIREGKNNFAESGVHFRRFVSRANTFAEQMRHGKGYAIMEKVSEENNLPKYAPVSYAQQRFTSSAINQWITISKGYALFCKAFDAINPHCKADETNQYKVKGFDFVVDLMSFLDLMMPMKSVMTAVQSVHAAPWKAAKYCNKLLSHYESMDFEELQLTPHLKENLNDLKAMNFQGIELNDGFLVVGETVEESEVVQLEGSSSRGKTVARKKKKKTVEWLSRELEDCLADAEKIRQDLITSLTDRIQKCVHPAMDKLRLCLDFSDWLDLLQGDLSQRPGPYDKIAFTVHGENEIVGLVAYLAQHPAVKASQEHQMDHRLAAKYLDNLKTAVAETVWGDLYHTVGCDIFKIVEGSSSGRFLGQVTPEPIVSLRETTGQHTDFALEKSYEVEMSNKSRYRVVLSEKALFKAFFTCEPLYSRAGVEACTILDFAWSLGGSEAIAETYFGIMQTQRKDGGQCNETLELRTLLDFCLPLPSQCPDTVRSISKLYLSGNGAGLLKHRLPIFVDSKE